MDQVEAIVSAPRAAALTRPLGPLEQFFYFADKFHPTHSAVAVRIAGRVEPAAWRAALDAVQRSYPGFSVCIAEVSGSAPVFRANPGVPIALELIAGTDPLAWQARFGREMATPFDTKHGPLVRAVVFHDAESAVFILVLHHSIADGRADVLAVLDVLRALAGQPVPPQPVQAPIEAAPTLPIPRADEASRRPKFLKKLAFVRAAKLPARAMPQIGGYFARKMRQPAWPAYHVVCRDLPAALISRVSERAAQERTSLNAALCAALAEAGRQLRPDWTTRPLRLMCPLDTRRLLDLGDAIGHFASVAPVVFAPGTSAPGPSGFWDAARHALKSVAAVQTRKGLAHSLERVLQAAEAGMDPVMGGMMMEHGLAHDIMLTNLGVVPSEPIGRLHVTGFWGAARLGYHDRLTVAAVMTNGVLHLMQVSSSGMLPQLLERTEAALAAACD